MNQTSNGLVFILDIQTADVIKGKYNNKQLEPVPISTFFYVPKTILEDNAFESVFEILSALPIKLLTAETWVDSETNLPQCTKILTEPE